MPADTADSETVRRASADRLSEARERRS
jgi:hypothetical protein